jgi:hypothetical protein
MRTNPYESPKEVKEAISRTKRFFVRSLIAIPLLYIVSFLGFWAFPRTFDLAYPGHPDRLLVIYSSNEEVHCALRAFYWPLEAIMPHRCYPTREQHRLLFRN